MTNSVSPQADITLRDEAEEWQIMLEGGIEGVQEGSASPSNIITSQRGRKYSSGDPHYSHEQQDTWHGGRGQEDFSDDQSRFYSGSFLTSFVPGVLTHGLLWKWSDTDHRDYNMHIPGSVTFRPLIGAKRYYASKFTAADVGEVSYVAAETLVLLRRRV